MLYLTCTTITSVDLAHYGVSRAKDWVSVYCGTIFVEVIICPSQLVLDTEKTDTDWKVRFSSLH